MLIVDVQNAMFEAEEPIYQGGEVTQRIAGMQTDYCINATSRRAADLGYRPILAADAHTTFDEGDQTAEEIIARHNRDLADASVDLQPSSAIRFA